ncbi:MAG: hypothetical protein ACLQOO_09490 [Terriglobia bacterium]
MLPEIEVRMPRKFAYLMRDGEITAAMYLTMSLLYTWADWDTGVVKNVSAKGLVTFSNHAFRRNTFQDALNRLEKLGHITRHMTLHSRQSYRVTINNFRVSKHVKAADGSDETC